MTRPKLIGQCRAQTHHHDRWLVQVLSNHSWVSTWEFTTFHDIRDPDPPRRGSFSSLLGEFNTFNGDLVCQALMQPDQGYPSWTPKLLNNTIAFDEFELAREYAYRLRTYGRWAHDMRKPALVVRLVREQVAHLVREYEI